MQTLALAQQLTQYAKAIIDTHWCDTRLTVVVVDTNAIDLLYLRQLHSLCADNRVAIHCEGGGAT